MRCFTKYKFILLIFLIIDIFITFPLIGSIVFVIFMFLSFKGLMFKNISNIKLLRLMIVVFCEIVFVLSISSLQLSISRRRGNEINIALENYKKENGVYPKKLQNLVPKYISEIPKSLYFFNNSFHYFTLPNGAYILFFSRFYMLFEEYNSMQKIWIQHGD